MARIQLVPVGDEPWTIEHVADLPTLAADYRRVSQSDEWYGLTIHPERRILIADRTSDVAMAETVVHELIHAALPRLHERTVNALARKITPALTVYGLRGRPA